MFLLKAEQGIKEKTGRFKKTNHKAGSKADSRAAYL